eukprot:GFYU01000593.1.p2 GENE.GFYU01000593.1~~GFYU01000593.1.p2  ORF type:complete len:217 (-),score=66.93 GFYU01000593.1:270-920(-)
MDSLNQMSVGVEVSVLIGIGLTAVATCVLCCFCIYRKRKTKGYTELDVNHGLDEDELEFMGNLPPVDPDDIEFESRLNVTDDVGLGLGLDDDVLGVPNFRKGGSSSAGAASQDIENGHVYAGASENTGDITAGFENGLDDFIMLDHHHAKETIQQEKQKAIAAKKKEEKLAAALDALDGSLNTSDLDGEEGYNTEEDMIGFDSNDSEGDDMLEPKI